MTDIPDDVMQAARRAAEKYYREMCSDREANEIAAGEWDEQLPVSAIASAIVAERERCAKIADENTDWSDKGPDIGSLIRGRP
ncbi:MAG: hypothetical protein HC900_00140 [Methylacidiphilales bacterium]|nr:hypothetical protein [Candidatus Methylacidiphilales bacterium]